MTKNEIHAALVLACQARGLKCKALSSFNSKAAVQAALDALPPLEVAKPTKTAGKKPSVSGRCQALLLEGKPTAEVWGIVKAEFNLPDSKKHYPGWNFAFLKRTGRLPA